MMKLTELYNFCDGLIPESICHRYNRSRQDYTRSIARAAEKQFCKNIRNQRASLCFMRHENRHSEYLLRRLSEDIKTHRHNAVKAKDIITNSGKLPSSPIEGACL